MEEKDINHQSMVDLKNPSDHLEKEELWKSMRKVKADEINSERLWKKKKDHDKIAY